LFWQGFVEAARRVLGNWSLTPPPVAAPRAEPALQSEAAVSYGPLENIVLTDGVSRTLFEEYAEHRRGERGDEETGWVLMGLRTAREAIALATLPAGAEREAGVAHVRFNAEAQALASRILRMQDRRLQIIGIVHTHPGRLRHPSGGDLEGDRVWVTKLRGGEGVFGIGTADGEISPAPTQIATQPSGHEQCYEGLRFSWYSLATGARSYARLPVRLTIGPDLALPLHSVWSTLEHHAERLDGLCRRLARIHFEVLPGEQGAELHAVVPLEKDQSLRAVLRGEEVEYCLVRKEQWLKSDSREPAVDRGVYLMLAALAERT
jgi:proteasome lid subunit RPN8/RPN11